MTIHYTDDTVTLHHGDCLDVLRELPDASVDSVVTDPPYGLEFMGKGWDSFRLDDPGTNRWRGENAGSQGAFGDMTGSIPIKSKLPAYGGQRPRTSRCLTCGKRDMMRGPHGCGESAEWVSEVTRPNEAPPSMLAFGEWCRQWSTELYRVLKPGGHMIAFGGSRTWHRLASAIEDAGFEIRDSIAWLYGSGFPKSMNVGKAIDKTELADGADWAGWGTALKPAFEPIVVGRKPLAGTVAANVLTHGTGALNIDGCRIDTNGEANPSIARRKGSTSHLSTRPAAESEAEGRLQSRQSPEAYSADRPGEQLGRWPANVVFDESQAAELDEQSGILTSGANPTRRGSDKFGNAYGDFVGREECTAVRGADSGGASRFFPTFRYQAKAPGDERPSVDGVQHPTVKPLDLMRWLVRLVTPPNGVVLEPFAGSGTTAEACVHEHMRCIAIERDAEYLPLIVARLSKPMEIGFDFGGVS